jgi:prevent-host-death family protein
MQSRVGVRELKNRATQIIRHVREQNAEYVVTVDGQPVARVIPVRSETPEERRARRIAALDVLGKTADQIAAKWPAGVSANDAVRAQRR